MAKVTPYLRTEWAVVVPWEDEPIPWPSVIEAREYVNAFNVSNRRHCYYKSDAKVVQRSVSDWGEDN